MSAQQAFAAEPQAAAVDPIVGSALKVFSDDELEAMSPAALFSLVRLLQRRLVRRDAPPALADLQAIRELITEHFRVPSRRWR